MRKKSNNKKSDITHKKKSAQEKDNLLVWSNERTNKYLTYIVKYINEGNKLADIKCNTIIKIGYGDKATDVNLGAIITLIRNPRLVLNYDFLVFLVNNGLNWNKRSSIWVTNIPEDCVLKDKRPIKMSSDKTYTLYSTANIVNTFREFSCESTSKIADSSPESDIEEEPDSELATPKTDTCITDKDGVKWYFEDGDNNDSLYRVIYPDGSMKEFKDGKFVTTTDAYGVVTTNDTSKEPTLSFNFIEDIVYCAYVDDEIMKRWYNKNGYMIRSINKNDREVMCAYDEDNNITDYRDNTGFRLQLVYVEKCIKVLCTSANGGTNTYIYDPEAPTLIGGTITALKRFIETTRVDYVLKNIYKVQPEDKIKVELYDAYMNTSPSVIRHDKLPGKVNKEYEIKEFVTKLIRGIVDLYTDEDVSIQFTINYNSGGWVLVVDDDLFFTNLDYSIRREIQIYFGNRGDLYLNIRRGLSAIRDLLKIDRTSSNTRETNIDILYSRVLRMMEKIN